MILKAGKEARFVLSKRMYDHMKNTLNDIETIIKTDSMSDKEKIKNIKLIIGFLKSVECGEEVITGLKNVSETL